MYIYYAIVLLLTGFTFLKCSMRTAYNIIMG